MSKYKHGIIQTNGGVALKSFQSENTPTEKTTKKQKLYKIYIDNKVFPV